MASTEAIVEITTTLSTIGRTVKHTASIDSLLFGWLDYLLFSLMLGGSAVIGVYFGFFGKKKQNNTLEYLMGGKTMSIFPIAMSLIARCVLK